MVEFEIVVGMLIIAFGVGGLLESVLARRRCQEKMTLMLSRFDGVDEDENKGDA